MVGMTRQDRIKDICNRSGQSEYIVRRVLEAETASVTESLKRGERANLMGRCTMEPSLRTHIRGAEGEDNIEMYSRGIKVKVKPSQALLDTLENIEKFEGNGGESQYNSSDILIPQIRALE
jgi:nucleoid DNA-binding protein